MKQNFKSVDAYIAAAPREVQPGLREMRAAIKAAAPEAVERISYGMPYYAWRGRLAYFGLARKHIGLYIPPPVIAEHRTLLKSYATAKATVRFPLDRKLPVALIRKLIRARIQRNEK